MNRGVSLMDQNDNNSNNDSNNEIQSYIYQQIAEFQPFVTPETLVMVVARDPRRQNEEQPYTTDDEKQIHRIAIVLKQDDTSIEAEASHDNIFQAIRFAKENLLKKLIQIKDEVDDSCDRLQAIQNASANEQIH